MKIWSPAHSYLDKYVQNKEQVNCEERGRQEIQKLNKSVRDSKQGKPKTALCPSLVPKISAHFCPVPCSIGGT